MGGFASRFIFTAVPDGESMLITYWDGKCSVALGPCTLPWSYKDVRRMEHVVANSSEYIVKLLMTGQTKILPGPATHWINPLTDKTVTKHAAMRIGEQELIVLYVQHKEDKDDYVASSIDPTNKDELIQPLLEPIAKCFKASRQILRGPAVYVPQTAHEWLHEFSWTGRAFNGPREEMECGAKRPDALKFQKLRVSPGKTYYDVASVRTSDGAVLTIKLMLFYQITNVETLLDNTNDPFADIFSSVSADIIEYFSPLNFAEALKNVDGLNNITTYTQLLKAAAKIGVTVEKVIFRGYSAPTALQKLHDSSIEAKTNLDLAAQRSCEEDRQADARLAANIKRAEDELGLKRNREKQELEYLMQKNEQEITLKRQKLKVDEEHTKALYDGEILRLRKLKELDSNMDIGAYLCTKDTPVHSVIQCSSMFTDSGFSNGASVRSFRSHSHSVAPSVQNIQGPTAPMS